MRCYIFVGESKHIGTDICYIFVSRNYIFGFMNNSSFVPTLPSSWRACYTLFVLVEKYVLCTLNLPPFHLTFSFTNRIPARIHILTVWKLFSELPPSVFKLKSYFFFLLGWNFDVLVFFAFNIVSWKGKHPCGNSNHTDGRRFYLTEGSEGHTSLFSWRSENT